MAVANAVRKISDEVDKICCVVCIAMLIAMVILTGAQIVCRIYFTALSWSEEATRYLLVWSTFIGGSIVYKRAGHITITLIQGLLPQAPKKILQTLSHLVCGIFCAIAIYFGFKYMIMQGSQISAALGIPMRLMYMAIPVGCAIIELHIIDAIIRTFVKGKEVATV
jgi:TRAP-type C4-dicarboxylate transport system permease small subunit